jgi:ubiquinone/menaquinone biosynthesis C-methylase UbiE
MGKETEITIKSYDDTVESFVKRTDPLHPKPLSDIFLKLIKNKTKILDLGCAQGRDTKYFLDKGYEVIGVDLSEKLIENAIQKYPKAKFEIMDIRDLKFPENSFDAIWANAILVHIPKKEIHKTLQGIKRIMKNDGIMMVCVKTKKDGKNSETYEKDKRHENVNKFWSYFSRDEFSEHLKNSGFEIIKIIEKNYSNENRDYGWINFFCKK